ncbi:hypothetical protein [Mycobacterium sp. GA-1841]|uniref:hypothetical protein n=1 Tax=Mycobacterium sp. GA-1841 TaxID=1834154 RepID=UPI0020C99F72|nr:hypothetical protein [Mycobacterium sp. GA-1841]
MTYRMHVIARDAAELAANAGGLIVDRMMSGWRVSVQLLENAGAPDAARPVQILGAELVDEAAAPGLPDEEQCVLVMGADAYARAISGAGQQIPTGCAEVLVWGESPDPSHVFGHSLSSAARAFKALAATAACISAEDVAAAEAFTSMNAKGGGVTLRA